jgi:ferredoxin--NADP+ reductase
MERASNRVDIWTNDGSEGRHGLVTDGMKAEFSLNGKPDLCIAVGPLVMMRAVSETTRPWGVKTLVSLNSIMVDGTGMCGGCRATVHGKTVFVCVEGPEVDGHGVDFEELMHKQQLYRTQEKQTDESYRKEAHECRLRSVIGED